MKLQELIDEVRSEAQGNLSALHTNLDAEAANTSTKGRPVLHEAKIKAIVQRAVDAKAPWTKVREALVDQITESLS